MTWSIEDDLESDAVGIVSLSLISSGEDHRVNRNECLFVYLTNLLSFPFIRSLILVVNPGKVGYNDRNRKRNDQDSG